MVLPQENRFPARGNIFGRKYLAVFVLPVRLRRTRVVAVCVQWVITLSARPPTAAILFCVQERSFWARVHADVIE